MASQVKKEERRVPKIRFPGFDGDWEEKRLGDVFEKIRNGFVGTATPHYVKNGVPYLQGKNIKNGKISSDELVFVSRGFHTKQKNSRLKYGDILMVQSGHVGECAVVGNEFEGGNCHALLVMTPKADSVDSDFVKNIFYSEAGKRSIKRIATGNTIQHVLASDTSKLKMKLPVLQEQQKIAIFLGVADEWIENLRGQKESLEEYKKGMMQKLFSVKGEKLPEVRFKDDDGKDFPDWDEKKLGEVFGRMKDKNKVGSTNVLTISAQQGLVDQLKYFKKLVSSKDLSGYYLLKRNDFTYNKSYSKGYPLGAVKRLTKFEEGVVSPLYICFRIKSSEGSVEYYEQFFESGGINRELAKITQEGARVHGLLNMSVTEFFRDVSMFVPKAMEQQKIAEFLGAVDEWIELKQLEVEKAEKWKKGLMQGMIV